MTKADRHRKILELIAPRVVSTQTELTELLIEAGYDVTQATTSRDLQEMRIVKVLLADGTYKYTAAKDNDAPETGNLRKILAECLVRVDSAENITVVKTITGAAQAAAFALESVFAEDILGAIAGDDTIMIVVRTERDAKLLCTKLQKYIG